MRTGGVALLATALLAAACSSQPGAVRSEPGPSMVSRPAAVTASTVTTASTTEPVIEAPVAPPPPTNAPPAPPTTPAHIGIHQGVLDRLRSDARAQGSAFGASVWVDGAEVAAIDAERALLPASNEKLFTAMAALEVLGADHRLETSFRRAGDTLFLVGGGDPWFDSAGLHALAGQAAAGGLAGVTRVVIDESRYDSVRTAPGWLRFHAGRHVALLTALIVDWRPGTAEDAVGALAAHGVVVVPGEPAPAPRDIPVVASTVSPPLGAVVRQMLTTSDNLAAELLLKEIGRVARGDGSTAAGVAAGTDALSRIAGPLSGTAADGSGLSRQNARSTGEWARLLSAAAGRPWFATLYDALPVAAQSGTLAGRFGGSAAAGMVRAKTGWIREARALSGYATTVTGQALVFSIIVNGPLQPGALEAIDDTVVALVTAPA